MNKKLFTQMWNERRSNLALYIELLLVSVVLWYVVDAVYIRLSVYFQPKGFDISHTYLITMNRLSEDNPRYDPDRVRTEGEDIFALRERISLRPDVEAASLSYYAHPYRSGTNFSMIEQDTAFVRIVNCVMTPEFIRVFRYQGARGETSEELAEKLKGGGVMIAGEILKEQGVRSEDIPGLRFSHDTARFHRKLALLQPVRVNDYDDGYESGGVVSLLEYPRINIHGNLCLRVKADQDTGFVKRFWKDASANYRVGNVYIQNIESVEDVQRNYHKYDEAQNKIYYGVMIFLLLNVFITLFGVFWFRTRQRRLEIAIQMAMGGTRKQVFRRLISEGICMLLLATLPALVVEYYVMKTGLVEIYQGDYFTVSRFAVGAGLTFLLIAGTIVCSIWYPAYKAARTQPADVLNESE